MKLIIGATLLYFAAIPAAGLALASDSDQITNIFRTNSTPANSISNYSLLVLAICAAIFVTVATLLIYVIIRFRRRSTDDDREPPQIYGSSQIELAWTVLPVLIVLVLAMVTARTIADIQNAKAPPAAVHATIVGHQWWWEIRYPDLGVVTANELHVPVSDGAERRPTFLTLESADVAHSFWVPQLAGKTDVIPNRENKMWIEPFKPGIYPGNCAEYCGTQHAHMLIRVVAETPDDFQKWVAAQQKPSTADAQVKAGHDLFFANSCVSCHTIRGTEAAGKFGPDLTHLMSRQTLGSGVAPNTPEQLRAWVRNPQELKVGCFMPNMQLGDQEVDRLVAYLQTLK